MYDHNLLLCTIMTCAGLCLSLSHSFSLCLWLCVWVCVYMYIFTDKLVFQSMCTYMSRSNVTHTYELLSIQVNMYIQYKSSVCVIRCPVSWYILTSHVHLIMCFSGTCHGARSRLSRQGCLTQHPTSKSCETVCPRVSRVFVCGCVRYHHDCPPHYGHAVSISLHTHATV